MNRFDEIFRRKAAEAFKSYDADHMADAGWNSFIRKYKRKPRSGSIIPFWIKAASVVLLITIGTIYTFKTIERKTQAGNIGDEKVIRSEEKKLSNTNKPADDVNKVPGPVQISSAVKNDKKVPLIVTYEKYPDSGVLKHPDAGESVSMKIPVRIPVQDIFDNYSNGLEVKEQDLLEQKKVAPGEPGNESHYSRQTTFMAGISGTMASAENITSSAHGVAIGFYIDYELNRRISLRPGLAVARHIYGLETTAGTSALNYTTPSFNGLSGSVESFKAQMDVVSMEVPVNIVFKIWKRSKSSLLLSTGISTVIYLDQHLTGSFRNIYSRESIDMATGEVYNETNYTVVDIESEQEAFSRVDYFGLVNVSAGYSLPFGKSGSLLLEPFIQLPVNNLTYLNLRIRYGGLSMKFRF